MKGQPKRADWVQLWSLRRGLKLSLGKTEPLNVFTQKSGKLSFAFTLWLQGGMLT